MGLYSNLDFDLYPTVLDGSLFSTIYWGSTPRASSKGTLHGAARGLGWGEIRIPKKPNLTQLVLYIDCDQ